MTWHGQINRTIWEIEGLLAKEPGSHRLRRELMRTHFLQRYEFDRTIHVPRDDRSFLFLQERQASAVLLLHGAAGTPAEMRDLGSYLFGKGFTVYCPRLSRYDVKNRLVSWESWVTMSENALTATLKYSRWTTVIGMSLGGTIALALDRLQPVNTLVLLAPAIYARMGLKGRLTEIVRHLSPTLFTRFAGWNAEVIKAMEHVRKNTTEVKTPTLVMQARDDHLISPRGLKVLKKWLKSENSDVIQLNDGSHALTRGVAKDEIFERTFEFIQRNQPPRRSRGGGGGGRRGGSRRGGSRRGGRRRRSSAPSSERPSEAPNEGSSRASDGAPPAASGESPHPEST